METPALKSAPVTHAERITAIDTLRGFALVPSCRNKRVMENWVNATSGVRRQLSSIRKGRPFRPEPPAFPVTLSFRPQETIR